MSGRASWWNDRVLPHLIERVCGSRDVAERRQRLVPRARGRVLEIGVGSGLNLPFYDRAHVTDLVGIDPSQPLLARARERLATAPVPAELVQASAERLPLASASFDSVVVTYSLCSVDDKAAALAEIRRVLSPGGALYFLEHGISPDRSTARWQRWLTPGWRHVSGGCRLDADVLGDFERAGFAIAEHDSGYGQGARWLSYLTTGVALRPSER